MQVASRLVPKLLILGGAIFANGSALHRSACISEFYFPVSKLPPIAVS
jgi:hypothetical protein